VVEVPVALDQAEAPGRLVEIAGVEDPGRVVERAPDPLACPVPDREPVGIVHLRAPVRDLLAPVLGVPEHRRQGCDPQPFDVVAQEQMVLDVHDHAPVAVGHDPEGAANAGPIEQGMDDDRIVLGGRGRNPVGDEIRELLGRAAGNVQRQAARRHADLPELADGTKIGRTEEGRPRLPLGPITLQPALLQPEPRKAVGIGRQLAGRAVRRHGEVVG
jgi:hypothetical protein